MANEPHLLPNSHPAFPKDKVSQCPHKDSPGARHTLLLCVFAPAQVRQTHIFIPFLPFIKADSLIYSIYPIPFLPFIKSGSQIYSVYPILFI